MLGGSLTYARFDIAGTRAASLRHELLAAVEGHPNIQVLCEATCNGWFTDNYLPVIRHKRLYKVRASRCLVAAGSFDQPVVFRNNDLPGVMLTSAAQRLMKLYAVKPGQRAVILTGHDDGYLAALDLQEQGVAVAALVDMRAAPADAALASELKRRDIPLHLGSTVYEALHGAQMRHVTGADIRPITSQGKVGDHALRVACDLLCMSAGYMPVYQLLCQAGGKLAYDVNRDEFAISNLPAGLDIAGSVNGRHRLDNVLNDASRAAAEALAALGLPAPTPPACVAEAKVNFPGRFSRTPRARTSSTSTRTCRCAISSTPPAAVTATCSWSSAFHGRHGPVPGPPLGIAHRPPGSPGHRSQHQRNRRDHCSPTLPGREAGACRRPCVRPLPADADAPPPPASGREDDAGRQLAAPGLYGKPEERERCMQEEARHVREKVGLIDVSTLGGLDVRGPDAAELLERLYTFGFAKLAIGRTRYALMTNEHGVVIDDGVCARLAEQHFYVTATTSGVDRIYQQMLKWNAQWRLDVDITNVSAALAAVNLAGPLSRQVLAKVCDDVELCAEAFPYLGVRQGKVAGIPARILRVGFVGELGYEIHVPARHAERLWDTLMQAGAGLGIRPFGVETQRLLRLEKAT